MTTASSRKLRRRVLATGLFAAAVLVSLIAAQCSSSEDSADDPTTTTTEATSVSTTTEAPPASATTEVPPASTSTTSPLVTTEPPPATTVTPEETDEERPAEEVPDGMTVTTMPARPAGVSSDSQITRVSLSSFDECDALMDYIRSEALERVGPHGLDDGFVGPFLASSAEFAVDEAVPAPELSFAEADSAAGAPAEGRTDAPASAPTQGVDYSGTNVQVEGVDEADIVKTDGRRIIGIGSDRSGNNEIWIADITSSTPRLQGRLALQDGYYQEFYLAGDRVFAIGTSAVGIDPPGGGGVFSNETDGETGSEAETAASEDLALSIAPRPVANAVVVTEVDISDPDNPEAVRHLRVEGRYISSRAADGYARVVVSSPPEKLGFVQPSYGSSNSEASAARFNRLLVQESTLDQWLPDYNLHAANGETVSRGQLLDCDRVFAPSVFSGFNQVSVLSFATGESLRLRDAVSTMANGETVYASPGNLYVSRVEHDYDDTAETQTAETVIHKFSLSSSGSADYEASGKAFGSPVNQWAFHEYQGRLFVATTSADWRDTESFVTVLEDDGSGTLAQVGKVGNLGRGEDIYAVRYIADKAYVVTFRQTDPLYVIDLSDPTDPTTEGELKITGYSAYLHPVGENLLLGVGREATTTGRVTGAKVSLFDVSDPSDPRTLDSLVLEGGSSEVEWDARAFLWWAPKKLAVVPINNWRSNYYGALALRVNADADSPEIELVSRISHDAATRPTGDTEDCEWYDVPSSSLIWTAESLSTMSVVKVCPATGGAASRNRGVPNNHFCAQLPRPGTENEEDAASASLDEIVEEVQSAASDNAAGDLPELLSKLQSSSVENASQVNICVPEFFSYDTSRQILRSIVITDDLWTLSRSYLQANDLDTLARRAWLDIPG